MNLKKTGVFLATCIASAALTVATLKILNDQFHIRQKLGLSNTTTPFIRWTHGVGRAEASFRAVR